MLSVAVVQMSSTPRVEDNLAEMFRRIDEARARKARAVFFPEMAYLMAPPTRTLEAVPRFDEFVRRLGEKAKAAGIWVFAGSLREPVQGQPQRFHNTAVVFAPDGTVAARYRKIFLFKANLPEQVYDEGRECVAGEETVKVELDETTVGLSICFDVRFPELYRALRRRGAQVLAIPSAFTVPTGKAHWELLCRARAVENQAFVVAAAQAGTIGEGRAAYGHSLVVAPWGEILADLGEGPGMWVGDLDLCRIGEAEAKVSAWASARPDILPIA